MSMSLALGLGLPFGGGGSAAVVPIAAPIFDSFTGAAANILGHVTDTGALTWSEENTVSGGLVTSLALTGSGQLTTANANGSNSTFTYGWIDSGLTGEMWAEYETNPAATATVTNPLSMGLYFNLTKISGAGWMWSQIGAVNGGATLTNGVTHDAYTLYTQANNNWGTPTTTLTGASNTFIVPGDRMGVHRLANGNVDLYLNGHRIKSGMVLTGITVTGKVGFMGENRGGPLAMYDGVTVIDPATQGGILVDSMRRTLNIRPDGTINCAFSGVYTGNAPSGLKWSLFKKANWAAHTPEASYTNIALTNFTAAAGVWSGNVVIPAADVSGLTAGVLIEFSRTADIIGGATSRTRTGLLTPGYVCGHYGQSLAIYNGGGSTPSATSAGWVCDSRSDTNFNGTTAEDDYRIWQPTATQPHSTFNQQLLTSGAASATMLFAGLGSTYEVMRQPTDLGGSLNIFDGLAAGLARAGGDLSALISIGGEYEVTNAFPFGPPAGWANFNSTDKANFQQAFRNEYDRLKSLTGSHDFYFVISPVGAYWSAPGAIDAQMNAVRRAQWEMNQVAIEGSSRLFRLGPYRTDLQHTDSYHLDGSSFGWAEQERRCGLSVSKALGLIADDHRGPTLVSGARNSATSITLTFNRNGATSLAIPAVADVRGGLRFYTDNTETTEKLPTAVSAETNNGDGTSSVTWTFAANSFPSTCYVFCVRGCNPFNPSNNGTTNASIQTLGSILAGVRAGENNVAVEPYFTVGGSDYLSLS